MVVKRKIEKVLGANCPKGAMRSRKVLKVLYFAVEEQLHVYHHFPLF